MNSAYKMDEHILKNIVKTNTRCVNIDDQLQLNIYYKSRKTDSLVMKNSPTSNLPDLKKTNVIYEFKCPEGDCELLNNCKYIGVTTTSLSRRLTMHLGGGGPYVHMRDHHKKSITRKQLVDNTKILYQLNNPYIQF